MSVFSELIKNFDKTRDYVREFFIYGFKVRGDFDGKSARTYDNEKRRVESWLGDFLRYDTTERGKQVAISVDSSQISVNPLYRALASRSFTDNDIRLHFLLLDLLSDGKPCSIRTLTERLSTEYDAVFDEQTVRGKLREYAAEGILIAARSGNSILYQLSAETPHSLLQTHEGLADAVKFFSCLPEFGFTGHTILQSAGLQNDCFLMKHNYIVHTLEDVILQQLSDAIGNEHSVCIQYIGRKRIPQEITGIPLKLYASAQTGRRYLILYQTDYKRLTSYRLDFIRRITDCGKCEKYREYADILQRNANRCYGVSFGECGDHPEVHTVRMTIRADAETEPYIIDRIQREKRCGSVECIGSGLYAFTAEVFDPNELMHWVKTFIGRIVSIEGASEETKRFVQDIVRMQRMYNEKEAEDAAVQ